MPSPFPGMDPWLEAPDVFPSLHDKLAVYISEELNARMPRGYVATIKNRVLLEEERVREPDVSVFGESGGRGGGLATLPGLVSVETSTASDPIEESYIEIIAAQGKRLVTAVEIISVSNKSAGKRNRKAYQAKQKEYHRAGVNLVEIDLLREEKHVTSISQSALFRAVGEYDYHISVRAERPKSRYFAAGIRLADRLPAIGIPLDRDTPPVTIDLQPLLDRAYDTGRYPMLVNYDKPCVPRLTREQRSWAEAILRAKGLLPAIPVPNP